MNCTVLFNIFFSPFIALILHTDKNYSMVEIKNKCEISPYKSDLSLNEALIKLPLTNVEKVGFMEQKQKSCQCDEKHAIYSIYVENVKFQRKMMNFQLICENENEDENSNNRTIQKLH